MTKRAVCLGINGRGAPSASIDLADVSVTLKRMRKYKTYQAAAGANAMTLQFDVDYDATDGTTAFQGLAVLEPSQSGQATVTNEPWP